MHGQIERVENFWWYIIVWSCVSSSRKYISKLAKFIPKAKLVWPFFIVLWSFTCAGWYAHSAGINKKKMKLRKKPHYVLLNTSSIFTPLCMEVPQQCYRFTRHLELTYNENKCCLFQLLLFLVHSFMYKTECI